MPPQRIVVSDRKFQGMRHRYPEHEVWFESMFESGNLDAVFKVHSLLIRWAAKNMTAL
jgi:hypothetical protein